MVGWIVYSVILTVCSAPHGKEQIRPCPRWQPISKWGQEYLEVVYSSDLGPDSWRCHRAFLISWHFQTQRKNSADESSILMGFWILFAAAAASLLVIQGKKKNYQADSGEEAMLTAFLLPFLLSNHGPCLMRREAACVYLFERLKIIIYIPSWWSKDPYLLSGQKTSLELKPC